MTNIPLPRVEQLLKRSDREWHLPKPSIVWDMKKTVRAGDPPEKVRPIMNHLMSSRFQHSTVIYTDGSKHENTTGAAMYSHSTTNAYSLPEYCSVFSAEAYAIRMALSTPNIDDLVIVTDSASCLQALESGKSRHPWIQEAEIMTQSRRVRFCWTPGHAGINGNIEADKLANEARRLPPLNIPIPAEDALRAVKERIRLIWDNQWFASRDAKLREIKNDTRKWTERNNAAEQRVLTRLRIGHTRLTHTFLLKRETPPNCECCGTTLDVKHILLHCRKYDNERQQYDVSTTSLRNALMNDNSNETKLMNFLRQTGLYKEL